MKDHNQKALKEWACVVRALGEGKQILLLRKGGIAEKGGEFRMEEPDFFLFPTFEHQDKTKLKPQAAGLVDESQKQADLWVGKVGLTCYAEVVEVFQVKNLEPLLRLSSYHIWSEGMVTEKFQWHPDEPIYIPLLRIYRLQSALLVDDLDRYGGCKSWVEFDRPIPTQGAKPVLTDTEFQLQQERIRGVVE